ncbi:MAG: hypothetical protein OXH75_14800 [Acidobacteria bacterium]|nr:hypothetical protein [Acidobacteriota bacterium]
MSEATTLVIAVVFFAFLGVSILGVGGALVAGVAQSLTPRAADLTIKTIIAALAVAFVVSLIAIGLQLVVPGQ